MARSTILKSLGYVVVLICLAVLMYCGFTNLQNNRLDASEARCLSRMGQLADALDDYVRVHGSLPPAYVQDKQGRPMHSWRVLLLPHLGESDFFHKYNFDVAWNHPSNRGLADTRPDIAERYQWGDTDQVAMNTDFFMLTGQGTMWPDSGQPLPITQQLTNTDKIIIVTRRSTVHWLDPTDIDRDQFGPYELTGVTTNRGAVLFANRNVGSIRDGTITLYLRSKNRDRDIITIR